VRVRQRVRQSRHRVQELLWWGGRWVLLVCWPGRRGYCLYENIMLKTGRRRMDWLYHKCRAYIRTGNVLATCDYCIDSCG
jgi:hypothetical protein